MGMVCLLGLGGCEGGVSAEIVEVESRGVGGEDEPLGRLGVKDGCWVNCITITTPLAF